MPDDDGNSPKTCFVAMPITTPDAYVERLGDPDHFAHVLAHLFTPALQAAGLKVIPPSVAGSEMIHAEIIKNLEQADFVLCDLSDHNPNVFFELGIRTSLDRPVILVKDDLTSKIPFDINSINTVTYGSSLTPWLLEAEVPRLTNFIESAVRGGDSGNAMWKYFGLTKRGVPSNAGANPIESKLDLIIRDMAKDRPSIRRVTFTPIGRGEMDAMTDLVMPILRDRLNIGQISYRTMFSDDGVTFQIVLPSAELDAARRALSEIDDLLSEYGWNGVRVQILDRFPDE